MEAIHFGGGALGRGLVVPRLVEAGWTVTVVDPLPDLVEALDRQGGYGLEMQEGGATREIRVPIARALHPERDRAELMRRLGEAPLVTTAVRKENLAGVARQLVAAGAGRAAPCTLLGCENVEAVDEALTQALIAAGIAEEALARLHIPRTVVDRICANAWPASTTIRTETYGELAASRAGPTIPGIEAAQSIDALFDRKRYLVNSLADAAAILGRSRGDTLLSQAFGDGALLAELAPFVDALQRHLALEHGLDRDGLVRYAATSRERLANGFIPRRLDTVARDLWRKMQPGERFFAPLIALRRRGEAVEAALDVLARLVRLSAALEGAPGHPAFGPAELRAVADRHGEDPALRSVYRDTADRIGKGG